MNLEKIKSLIQFISKSDIREIKIQIGRTKIHIKNSKYNKNNKLKKYYPKISSYVSDFPDRFSNKLEKDNDNQYLTIKSPMIGTFYRRPHPDKDPFVRVGDKIKIGTKVCVIEAMKLFNDIESEVNGKLVKVLVEDATPVDYDQPLFILDPD
ncbi:acetyl-CoA carboxylase biotin carboxyl carrier protein [Blattabacterium cuenoti]|uniref:acetyl-CoA carboxylase biotin carboxyl carrier protein n=1 Tax=Blattabacterium cuenoti TaxID=1653831 RepID=UPI00163C7C29|nr:acetyl-CoA carboxylase biotin carboxyl carrier protein [Blattabacterium cuenoti]